MRDGQRKTATPMLAASCVSQSTIPMRAMILFFPDTCRRRLNHWDGRDRQFGSETTHRVDAAKEKGMESDLRNANEDHPDADAVWEVSVGIVHSSAAHLRRKRGKKKRVSGFSSSARWSPSA